MIKYLSVIIALPILFGIKPDFPPPPGTKKVEKNIYIDKRPVTYLDYSEFLHAIKLEEPSRLPTLYPSDTFITFENKILWNNPEFHDFPILGLDLAQIRSYCEWRSTTVNQLINNASLRCADQKYWKVFDKLDPKKEYSVSYTLPDTGWLEKYCSIATVQLFDELLEDGFCFAKNQDSSTMLNRTDLFAFRCVARYEIKAKGDSKRF